jgi:hypothetical protein
MEAIAAAISQYAIFAGPGVSSNGFFEPELLRHDLTNKIHGVQIFSGSVGSLQFKDSWGNPVVFEIVTNRPKSYRILIRSAGPDNVDQKGSGDDIVVKRDVTI